MIKLTKEEKSDLLDLQKKLGFKVMLKIMEDFELDVFKRLKNTNLKDDKQLHTLGRNMDYLKGIEDVMGTLTTGNNQVSERKSDEQKEKEIKEKEKKEQA